MGAHYDLTGVMGKGTATRLVKASVRRERMVGWPARNCFLRAQLSSSESLYYRFYTMGRPPVYQQQQKTKEPWQTDGEGAWPAFYGLGEEDGRAK